MGRCGLRSIIEIIESEFRGFLEKAEPPTKESSPYGLDYAIHRVHFCDKSVPIEFIRECWERLKIQFRVYEGAENGR